jgi:hypothetical protein
VTAVAAEAAEAAAAGKLAAAVKMAVQSAAAGGKPGQEKEEEGALSAGHLADALEMARNIMQAAAAAQAGGSLHAATLVAAAAADSLVAATAAARQPPTQGQLFDAASGSGSASSGGTLSVTDTWTAFAQAPAVEPLQWDWEETVEVPPTNKGSMVELLRDLDELAPAGSTGEHLAQPATYSLHLQLQLPAQRLSVQQPTCLNRTHTALPALLPVLSACAGAEAGEEEGAGGNGSAGSHAAAADGGGWLSWADSWRDLDLEEQTSYYKVSRACLFACLLDCLCLWDECGRPPCFNVVLRVGWLGG